MNKVAPVQILLADFQFLTRKSIAALIEETPGLSLLAEIEEAEEIIPVVNKSAAQLLVLDIWDECEAFIQEIITASKQANTQLLIITNSKKTDTIGALIKAGVKGIVTKNCSQQEIVNALQAVAQGQRFYCNSILNMVMEPKEEEEKAAPTSSLSPRELEVLQLIADGLTTDKIAEQLYISVHTVNSHRKNMLRKLNITSPIHLVAFAVETGLVTLYYPKK